MKIAIVDYKMGNIKSVYNALKFLKTDPVIVDEPSELNGDKIIIPGVGAFGEASLNLVPFGSRIRESITSGVPLLGICLGLQILLEDSEESSTENGLGIIKGTVRKMKTDLSVPHIGWNHLKIKKKGCPLFKDVTQSYVYFVHSYEAKPEEDVTAATTNYGHEICASIWDGDVFGTQFHPEKSGKVGLKILKNFVEL
jgi:glutamine amidotransferase